jgi:hypothetical protein
MRLKRAKWISIGILLLLGTAGLAVAFFAVELGLDQDRKLGGQRLALAYLGGTCLALAAILFLSPWLARLGRSALAGLSAAARRLPWPGRALDRVDALFERIECSSLWSFGHRHAAWWAGLGALGVALVTWWYLTSGTLTTWVSYSHYFDRQGEAFLAGQLYLLETPPAGLLALPNPYDWQRREAIGGYLWDSSLYQGKYYLYWGPVPALLAAAGRLASHRVVEDQYLLFVFIIGLAASLAALLHELRRSFYPSAPAWSVPLLAAVAGLSAPVFWLVNRPSVYETAISAGQCFLILGLMAAVRGLRPERPQWGWLGLAGFAWGAAAGSRVNTALAIGWMAALTCLYLWRHRQSRWGWVAATACLLGPLALWGAGLGWYNLARFGSLLETGHRYQLTGPALPANYSQVASIQYLMPNLYNLLARPLSFQWGQFPFVFAPYLTKASWPGFIRLVDPYYFSEPVAGMFLAVPVFWLAFTGVIGPVRNAWAWLNERAMPMKRQVHPLSGWVWWMVGGSILLSLGSLSIFIMTTMRYEADLIPLMTVFTALALWQLLDSCRARPRLRRWLFLLVLVAGLASILIGLLVNFQNGDKRFAANNPQLYQAIAHFFSGRE